MTFDEARELLLASGYKFYYNKMLSGGSYDTPEGEEVFLSESEVIKLASSKSN